MYNIWGVDPLSGKVEIATNDGKVYIGRIWALVDMDEFDEEDGVTEDFVIMKCDGEDMLTSLGATKIISMKQL